mmetsp:Transcript_70627/g.124450  ORF Transcript_70627/g.124450 Transcript_70627/m.124450 type:complete len:82 (-) Transcript_70627:45-290(-)
MRIPLMPTWVLASGTLCTHQGRIGSIYLVWAALEPSDWAPEGGMGGQVLQEGSSCDHDKPPLDDLVCQTKPGHQECVLHAN